MDTWSDQRLGEAIVHLAKETWTRDGNGLLLSQLGLALKRVDPSIADALGNRKLLAFIENNLSSQLHVIRHPDHPAVVGIFPVGVAIDDATKTFALPSQSSPRRAYRGIRFDSIVWAAFSFPLETGMRRFLSKSLRGSFMDVASASPPNDGDYEIPLHFIIPRPTPATAEQLSRRAAKLDENIREWARQLGIPISRLEADLQSPRSVSSVAPTEAEASHGVLDLLFAALSEADLRRIHLPLDIVKKLQGRMRR